MKFLFCNIGWMEKYNGIDGDSIQRGGDYNKTATGHEVCNFTRAGDDVYGYVQPTGQIKIERLGAEKHAPYIENITVVWLAGPDSGGTAVVGWYKNATVYREPQKFTSSSAMHRKNGIATYRIKARWSDAVLLPSQERNLMIPRSVKGGIGQSNVWYADATESQVHIDRVNNLINGLASENDIPDVDQEAFGTEGNPRFRAHIVKERNQAIINKKKKSVLAEKGALKCEVCDFDFSEYYGKSGEGFCEVHHIIPLHKSDGITVTKLSDLAIVCSNCHRMLHRKNPMLSILELSNQIRKMNNIK